MSGGPYRELFVELTDAAFAIAKGIGEQAVKQAQERQAPKPDREPSLLERMLLALTGGPGMRYLQSRYGWIEHEFHRPAFDRSVVVVARFDCGHGIRFSISELALHLAPRGEMLNTFLDLIDRRMSKGKRCYCVAREIR